MNLRKVSFQDYKKIFYLFKRNNLKLVTFEQWKNLWQKNPFLKGGKQWTKGWLIEEKNKITGHFGSFPTTYFLNNKLYLCSVLHGWVVDNKYRSQSILLLKKFFLQNNVDLFISSTTNPRAGKIMEALGFKKLSLATLNSSSFIILNFENTLKFLLDKSILPFKGIILNLIKFPINLILNKKINYWKNNFSEKNIVRHRNIDTKFDFIWKKIKSSYSNNLILKRDKKWLKWKLDYFLKKNQAWLFFSIKNNKINGYAICIENKNANDGLKRAFMIDLISFNQNKEVTINLVGSCIKEAKKRNCDVIEFRGFSQSIRSNINFFKPFIKKIKDNPFYYKSNNINLKKILNKSYKLTPTYLDGDSIVSF
tara:strand:+ start:3887 stop:4984 length:1098 start_codon:yes stop_codon:yes gene_type:complete